MIHDLVVEAKFSVIFASIFGKGVRQSDRAMMSS